MTNRQLMMYGVAAVLGLIVAVAGILGSDELAQAGLAVLVTGILLVLLDMRRRQGEMARRLKRVAERLSVDSQRLGQLRSVPDRARRATQSSMSATAPSVDVAIGRVEAAGEGLLAGLAQERLASVERHLELLRLVERIDPGLASLRNDLLSRLADLDHDGQRNQAVLRENL